MQRFSIYTHGTTLDRGKTGSTLKSGTKEITLSVEIQTGYYDNINNVIYNLKH